MRRLLAACACVVWILGSAGDLLHGVMVTHVLCQEHGVVEHAPDAVHADPDHDAAPSVRSAQQSSHGEECPLECIPGSSALVPTPALGLAYVLTPAQRSPFVYQGAPRGPPLAFAPKTSPPGAT
jgi:hypothetical protein